MSSSAADMIWGAREIAKGWTRKGALRGRSAVDIKATQILSTGIVLGIFVAIPLFKIIHAINGRVTVINTNPSSAMATRLRGDHAKP